MAKPNWSELNYIPISQIELSLEVGQHPELLELLLTNHHNADIGERIAAVAAYCEIVVDGMYSPSELDDLCELLIRKLQQKRHLIVLPMSGTIRLH